MGDSRPQCIRIFLVTRIILKLEDGRVDHRDIPGLGGTQYDISNITKNNSSMETMLL